jgi:hypothetical protein
MGGRKLSDVAPLLISVAERGGVVGGICAGTLALARAGLFSDRAHTSNGRGWILEHVPGYAGDGALLRRPARRRRWPACQRAEALYPERKEQIAQMRTMFAGEYRATGSGCGIGKEDRHEENEPCPKLQQGVARSVREVLRCPRRNYRPLCPLSDGHRLLRFARHLCRRQARHRRSPCRTPAQP